MDWLNEIQAWFISATGSKIFLDAILPFVAIVLAGIVAASIGRGSSQRVIDQHDRELTSAAVIALIVVGRKAAIWSSLGGDEKQHVDALMSDADIRVRLLPTNGSSTAADWAAHELASMKKNSASFSFQADQSLIDYRDRLLSWAAKPRRARKLFASDLEQWRYDDDSPAAQQNWAAETTELAASVPAAAPVPAPTPAPVAPVPSVAPTTSSIPVVAAPAPVAATPSTFAPQPALVVPAATPPTTGSTTVTPGLATAAPPTVAPMDAPAPVGVATPAPSASDDGDNDGDDD